MCEHVTTGKIASFAERVSARNVRFLVSYFVENKPGNQDTVSSVYGL